MEKKSVRYKRGFREGYNNPNQHSNLDLNKVPENDDYSYGLISGVIKRRADRLKGDDNFIFSDEDLKQRLEENEREQG